jgi:hypothetical protein
MGYFPNNLLRNCCLYGDLTTRTACKPRRSQDNHLCFAQYVCLKNLCFTVKGHHKDIAIHCCSTCEIWGSNGNVDGHSSILGYDTVLIGRYSRVEEVAFTIFGVWQYSILATWHHIADSSSFHCSAYCKTDVHACFLSTEETLISDKFHLSLSE